MGILLSSLLLKNTHLGLESVLGNLEAITFSDIKRLFFTLASALVVFRVFRTQFDLISFDAHFGSTIGMSVESFKKALVFIGSLALMVCFRSLGVILVLSLLTAPILFAKLFVTGKKQILLLAFVFVLLQTLLSLAFVQHVYEQYQLPLSTSGFFAFLGFFAYLLGLSIRKIVRG